MLLVFEVDDRRRQARPETAPTLQPCRQLPTGDPLAVRTDHLHLSGFNHQRVNEGNSVRKK
jgi:hypothetical protein